MSEVVTKLEFKEYQQLYEQVGSKNLTLQAEISKEITTNQLTLYLKTVDFIYRIISVLGIFAGFGFTALAYVVNFRIFILGEVVLLSSILVGLYFVPKVYIAEYNALEKLFKKYQREIFNPRNEVLGRIVNTYTEMGLVKHNDLEEIQKYDKKFLEIMEISEKEKNNPFEKPITYGLVFSALGLILLLVSFLSFTGSINHRLVGLNARPTYDHEFRR